MKENGHEVARVTDEVKAAEESFRLPPGRPSPEVGEGRFDPMRPVAAKTPVNNKSAHLTDEVMTAVLGLCLLVTVGFLFLILGYLVVRGAGSFDLAFFTKLPAPVGQKGGGLANAFVSCVRVSGCE